MTLLDFLVENELEDKVKKTLLEVICKQGNPNTAYVSKHVDNLLCTYKTSNIGGATFTITELEINKDGEVINEKKEITKVKPQTRKL